MNGTKRTKQRTSSEKRILLAAVRQWSRGVLASTNIRATVASVDIVPSSGRNNRTVGQFGCSWSNTKNAAIENVTRIRKLSAQIARFKFIALLDAGNATLGRW